MNAARTCRRYWWCHRLSAVAQQQGAAATNHWRCCCNCEDALNLCSQGDAHATQTAEETAAAAAAVATTAVSAFSKCIIISGKVTSLPSDDQSDLVASLESGIAGRAKGSPATTV